MSTAQWKIHPYVGFGDLRFGMSRNEVASLIGPPASIDTDADSNSLTEFRLDNGLQAVFDAYTGGLVMVSAYANVPGIELAGKSLDWDNTRALYRELVSLDAARARQSVGITVLFGLGVSFAGFMDRDPGGKSITAFALGQWDEGDPALRPLAGT
jgi:hypothetical protein